MSTLALLGGAGPAFAQTAGAAATTNAQVTATSEGGDAAAVQEVIVTAERREESVMKVPVTVAAFSASTLKQAGVHDLTSLETLTPALSFQQIGPSATPFIRGVGTTVPYPGYESGVAIYIDGVYMAAQIGTLASFNNIASVEVDEGPQGTLFGTNATGGVIQIATKTPSHTPSADISAGYGNYNTSDFSFYGTTGLTDNLAADLAVIEHYQADGFGKNLTDGKGVWYSRDFGVRSKLLWTPDDKTNVTLAVDFGITNSDLGAGDGEAYPDGALQYFTGLPKPGGFYDVDLNIDQLSHSQQGGSSLTVTHDFGSVSFKSISAVRDVRESNLTIDAALVPLPLIDVNLPSNEFWATQELQLISRHDQPFTWVVGAYFLYDKADNNPDATQRSVIFGGNSWTESTWKTGSEAIYGQGTYDFGQGTRITGGFRYSGYQLSAEQTLYAGTFGALVPGSNLNPGHETNDAPSYHASIDHHFTPDLMVYGSFTHGFQSGNFNRESAAPYGFGDVAPEKINAYEAGVKSSWFDHRLDLSASYFHYDYTNLQVQSFQGAISVLYNAANAVVDGGEINLQAEPIEHLSLIGGASFLDARFASFPEAPYYEVNPAFPWGLTGVPAGGNVSVPGCPEQPGHPTFQGSPSTCSAAGNKLPQSPAVVLNGVVQYDFITPGGTITPSLTLNYNGGFFFDPQNAVRQPAYTMVNATVTYTPPNKKWDVKLWGRNLADVRRWSAVNPEGPGEATAPMAPLTFGGTVDIFLR